MGRWYTVVLEEKLRKYGLEYKEVKSTTRLACVAWRFWLLINKGGRGQKNREEIWAD